MDKGKKIDAAVGKTASINNILNDNLDVGAVTNRHGAFPELLCQIKENKSLDDAKAVFHIGFGNNGGENGYESPIGEPHAIEGSGNIVTLGIDLDKASKIIEQCKNMEITEANVIKACSDLGVNGRMGQETTVDSSKTADKVRNIPYCEEMKDVHLMSKDCGPNDFMMSLDFRHADDLDKSPIILELITDENPYARGKNGILRMNGLMYRIDSRKSHSGKVKRQGKVTQTRFICDFMHENRAEWAEMTKDLAYQILHKKQAFDPQMLAEIRKTCRSPKMLDALKLVMFKQQEYYTVVSYVTAEAKMAKLRYRDPNEYREHLKVVKAAAKAAYKLLSDVLRTRLRNFTDEEKVALLLATVYSDKSKKSYELSSYGHVALSPEFFKVIMELLSQDETVCQYTENQLTVCTFKDGDMADFVIGEARGSNDEFASAKVDLDGTFEIHKLETGKFVARKKVSELVTIPTPNPKSLCFTTAATLSMSNGLKDMMGAISGKVIYLVPHYGDIHDAIICDGKIVGHFRTKLAGDNVPSIRKMYEWKCGKVTSCLASSQEIEMNGAKVHRNIAFVGLSDVKRYDASLLANIEVNEVKKEAVKTNVPSCFSKKHNAEV